MVAKIATLPAGHGYNAATGEYGDLAAQGVIDPVKVTRLRGRKRRLDRRHAADHRDPGGREAGGRRPPRPTATGTATRTKGTGTSHPHWRRTGHSHSH